MKGKQWEFFVVLLWLSNLNALTSFDNSDVILKVRKAAVHQIKNSKLHLPQNSPYDVLYHMSMCCKFSICMSISTKIFYISVQIVTHWYGKYNKTLFYEVNDRHSFWQYSLGWHTVWSESLFNFRILSVTQTRELLILSHSKFAPKLICSPSKFNLLIALYYPPSKLSCPPQKIGTLIITNRQCRPKFEKIVNPNLKTTLVDTLE